MITIVEPKEHIDKLWGKQKVCEGETYRLMRYVLRVDHEDKVLLHNVVTGRLVVLEREEAEALETLPSPYSPVMEQLVTEHYLVPEKYDENQQVLNLRNILRKFEAAYHTTDITHYVILTTTACNARCYYCYQQGLPTSTMTEKTANQVVDFICNHCGDKKQVTITWFGGEPTIAIQPIDLICQGLREKDIEYRSFMISNGYLFNEDMVDRAKSLWNLRHITITIDGTEKTYNRTKAYVSPCENPYQRVMRNIGLMLDSGIMVKLRMNYDVGNWKEYLDLLKEVTERFQNKKLLEMSAHRIIGEFPSPEGDQRHGDEAWFEEKTVELDATTRDNGFIRESNALPVMRYKACGATNDMMTVITPEGNLVTCPDQLQADQIKGNIWEGVTNFNLVSKWKQFVEYPKCADCYFMPQCVHMLCCGAKDNCTSRKGLYAWASEKIRKTYDKWLKQN